MSDNLPTRTARKPDTELPFAAVVLVSTHILLDARGSAPVLYKIDTLDLPDLFEGEKPFVRLVPVNPTDESSAAVLTEPQSLAAKYHRDGVYTYQKDETEDPLYLTPFRLMRSEDAVAVIKAAARVVDATYGGTMDMDKLTLFVKREREDAVKALKFLNRDSQ